jgi:hypothetical protein
MDEKKKRFMRSLAVAMFLAGLTIAGAIEFGIITFLQIQNPNPIIIATNSRNGQPFYMCENASLSTVPCMFVTVQTTGSCTMGFNFTGGNGTVAKVELTDMNGVMQADLTNGANYTWSAASGTMYAIRVTRLIDNSIPGNLTWSDCVHN